MAVKYFNNAVLNFEASNLQENIDTHLSKYCYCQNDYFSKTFIHPDMQEKVLDDWKLDLGFKILKLHNSLH